MSEETQNTISSDQGAQAGNVNSNAESAFNGNAQAENAESASSAFNSNESNEQKQGTQAENANSSTDNQAERQQVEYKDIKLPEGMEIKNKEQYEKFLEFGKGQQFKQEDMEKFLEFSHASDLQNQVNQKKALQDYRKETRATIESDPELGGTNFNQSLTQYHSFISEDVGFTPEAIKLIQNGAIDHPEIFKSFVNIYKKHFAEKSEIAKGGAPKNERQLKDKYAYMNEKNNKK